MGEKRKIVAIHCTRSNTEEEIKKILGDIKKEVENTPEYGVMYYNLEKLVEEEFHRIYGESLEYTLEQMKEELRGESVEETAIRLLNSRNLRKNE